MEQSEPISHKTLKTLPLFAIIALIFVLFRNFFSHGFLAYPDFFEIFPPVVTSSAIEQYISAWNYGFFGGPNTFYLPDYLILSLLSNIGVFGTISQIFILILFLLLTSIGLYLLIGIATDNIWIKCLSIYIYIITPTLFIEIFDGSANIPFYALAPIYLYFGIGAVIFRRFKSALLFGVALAFGIFFNPFIVVFVLPIVFVLLLISILKNHSLTAIMKGILYSFIPFIVGISLNIPYFMSYVLNPSIHETLVGVSVSQGSLMMQLYSWANPLLATTTLGGGIFPRYSMFYSNFNQGLLLILPISALFSFFNTSKNNQHKLLKQISALLILSSYFLIELGHFGVLEIFFNKFPILYVDNYPSSFSEILNLGYAVLIPLFLIPAKKGKVINKYRIKNIFQINFRNILYSYKAIFAIIIVIFLIIPTNSYLVDGDFNQSKISANTLFPPQWSATTPSSFYSIYNFLKSNNGLINERPLILPYPGFNGGQEFRGFDPYIFDQQYTPSPPNGSSLINLGSDSSAYFSTLVINGILNNETNLIGVPLGYASVKYIIVDKQLNFSGQPKWDYGSLIGSPMYFFNFLKYQSDLRLIFNNSTFSVFLNLNYKPYVQGYNGKGLIFVNSSQVGNEITCNISLNNSLSYKWKLESAYGTINYDRTSNGYMVNNTKFGNYSIYFKNNNGNGQLSVINRVGALPIYLESQKFFASAMKTFFKINVANLSTQDKNAYISIFGFNRSGKLLWIHSIYPSNNDNPQSLSLSFLPLLVNSSTSFFRIAICLPNSGSSDKITNLTFSDPELVLIPPEPLNPTLLPIISYKMLPIYLANNSFPTVLSYNKNNLSNINSNYINYAFYVNVKNTVNSSYSNNFYLYNMVNYIGVLFHYNFSSIINSPESIYDYSLLFNSRTSLNLDNITGYHYINEAGLYASGYGNISLILKQGSILRNITFEINSPNYTLTLNNITKGNYTVSSININGKIVLTSLVLLINKNASNNAGLDNSSNLSILSESFNSFNVRIGNKTHFIFLSQSYNYLWEMKSTSFTTNPNIGMIYGNLFSIPGNVSISQNFTIYIFFSGQTTRNILIITQMVFWIVVTTLLSVEVFFPKIKQKRKL